MDGDKSLLCGRCHVGLEVSANAYDDRIVRCPMCGETDTLSNALREAGQHVAHKLLSGMLRGAFSGLATKQPALHFRFVEAEDR